jgi:hypothetical protein
VQQITLPEGTAVRSDASDIDGVLSRALGRQVRLASTAPEEFTIDQYHPDIKDVDPSGQRDATEEETGSCSRERTLTWCRPHEEAQLR